MGSLCAKADAIEDEPKEILDVDTLIKQQQLRQQQIGVVGGIHESHSEIRSEEEMPAVKARAMTCPPGPVPRADGKVSFRMMARARSGTGPPRRNRRPVYKSFSAKQDQDSESEQQPLKIIPEEEESRKYKQFAQQHGLSINLSVMGAAPGNPATAKYVPRRLPQNFQMPPPADNVPAPQTPDYEKEEPAVVMTKPAMPRKRRPSKFVYNPTTSGAINRPRGRSTLGQPSLDLDELARRL